MTLPNILTLARIALTVVLVFCLEQNSLIGNVLGAVVFTVACLTDFYDGHLAKTRGLISDFGKIMDPIADKILILSVFVVFVHIGMVAWWMVLVIAGREIAVTVSRLLAMRRGQVLAAERAGKIKTVLQILSISVILLYLIAEQSEWCLSWFYDVQNIWQGFITILMLAAMLMTLVSGVMYFRNQGKKA